MAWGYDGRAMTRHHSCPEAPSLIAPSLADGFADGFASVYDRFHDGLRRFVWRGPAAKSQANQSFGGFRPLAHRLKTVKTAPLLAWKSLRPCPGLGERLPADRRLSRASSHTLPDRT